MPARYPDAAIAELHAAYCQATGFDLPLRMGRDRAWFDFEKAGFTKEDLLLVVRWIRKQIPRNNGYTVHSLRFSTLILRLDEFEEKLALARHEMKLRPPGPGTVIQEQRVGPIRRQVETSAGSDPVPAGPEIEKFMRDLAERRARRFPLPTSTTGKSTEGHGDGRTSAHPHG